MSFGSDAGGIEKSLIEFLNLLSERDLDIDLYLWRKPGILFQYIPKKVNIISKRLCPGSLKDGLHDSKVLYVVYIFWYFIFRLFRILGWRYNAFLPIKKEYDIAISYCQNGYSPYYVIDKINAKKKYLWYHHGSYDKKAKEKLFDIRYYNKYNKIITVSKANKVMLEKHFPFLSGKILVIPNLINEEEIIRKSKEFKI